MNIKKFLHFSIGPIAAAFLGVLTIPVLAWLFSVEDIGRFSILQIVLSFSCVFFTLGLDQAYVREYHDTEDHGVLFKTVFLTSILLCLICILLFSFNINFIAEIAYEISSSYLSWLTIVCVLLTITLRYVSLIIRMQEKGFLYSISQVFPKLILLLSVSYLYFFYRGSFSFYQLVVIQTISLLVVCILFIFFTRRDFIKIFYGKFDIPLLKVMLSFGFPLVISGLVFWLMQSSSRVFLLKFSTLKEVGIFSVAVSIAAGFSVLTSIFNTIWAPTIFKLIKDDKGKNEVEKVAEIIALIIAIIIVFMVFLMPIIPKFLPQDYYGVEYVILLCVMQPLFYTLSEATGVGILIKRKTKYSILISILVLLINSILLLFLVPKYGALGAAISVSIAFWLYFVLRTEFSKKIWENIRIKKIYLSTLLCLIFVLLIGCLHLDYGYIVLGAFLLLLLNIIIFINILKIAHSFLMSFLK